MAVPVFDATSTSRATSTGLTVSHTCTGSNRLLVVDVIVRNTTAVNGVTYSGTAMTRGPEKQHTTDTLRVVQFYLPAPASGANNIVVTLAASTDHRVNAMSYTGADQSTPLNASNTADGTSGAPTVNVVTTVADCIVVDGVIHESVGVGTVGAGQTARQNNDNLTWADACSEEGAATASTVTMSWSNWNSDTWVQVAGAYKAAGGGAAPAVENLAALGVG